jgi:hypothetical protein
MTTLCMDVSCKKRGLVLAERGRVLCGTCWQASLSSVEHYTFDRHKIEIEHHFGGGHG